MKWLHYYTQWEKCSIWRLLNILLRWNRFIFFFSFRRVQYGFYPCWQRMTLTKNGPVVRRHTQICSVGVRLAMGIKNAVFKLKCQTTMHHSVYMHAHATPRKHHPPHSRVPKLEPVLDNSIDRTFDKIKQLWNWASDNLRTMKVQCYFMGTFNLEIHCR